MSVRVVTTENLTAQLTELAQKSLQPWLVDNKLNFASCIMFSMSLVEQYSRTVAKIGGSDKLAVAKLMIPIVVDQALSIGAIDQPLADQLKSQLAMGADILENVIEAYVLISKNPQFIQAQQAVEQAVSGCVTGCKTRFGKK